MATLLDIGLIKGFSSIFPFLFVLVITWAILLRVKLFAENKAFATMIAFLFAIAIMFSPIATKTINLMAPWFVLLFVAIVFVLIVYQSFGVSEATILGLVTGKDAHYGAEFFWTLLSIIIVILLGSLFTVLSEEGIDFRAGANVSLAQQTPLQYGISMLTHPKILGFIIVMLIAVFTIQRLVSEE
ncbi:hypothetical protein HY485_05510 [Candidatus Woesearchaeota archaeon]|nr:hypothetical protein [Candidatus Woesearchaeota archaeon]